jgi:hypothetical protein
MAARNVDFLTATRELASWLGMPLDSHGSTYSASQQKTAKGIPEPRQEIRLPDLVPPTREDIRLLSGSRSIDPVPLRIAVDRGLWCCFDDNLNGRCWVITDSRRRCAIRRRIDNKPFQLKNGTETKAAAVAGSEMSGPIGYREAQAFPSIGIVEGGPNALAVLAHAWASSVEDRVAPICMPSTSANFHQSSLTCLQGKRGRIFIDNDRPGMEAAERWADQLRSACVNVDGFDFSDLSMSDGRPVGDLNDLCRVDEDCWEANREVIESVMDFATGGGRDGGGS